MTPQVQRRHQLTPRLQHLQHEENNQVHLNSSVKLRSHSRIRYLPRKRKQCIARCLGFLMTILLVSLARAEESSGSGGRGGKKTDWTPPERSLPPWNAPSRRPTPSPTAVPSVAPSIAPPAIEPKGVVTVPLPRVAVIFRRPTEEEVDDESLSVLMATRERDSLLVVVVDDFFRTAMKQHLRGLRALEPLKSELLYAGSDNSAHNSPTEVTVLITASALFVAADEEIPTQSELALEVAGLFTHLLPRDLEEYLVDNGIVSWKVENILIGGMTAHDFVHQSIETSTETSASSTSSNRTPLMAFLLASILFLLVVVLFGILLLIGGNRKRVSAEGEKPSFFQGVTRRLVFEKDDLEDPKGDTTSEMSSDTKSISSLWWKKRMEQTRVLPPTSAPNEGQEVKLNQETQSTSSKSRGLMPRRLKDYLAALDWKRPFKHPYESYDGQQDDSVVFSSVSSAKNDEDSESESESESEIESDSLEEDVASEELGRIQILVEDNMGNRRYVSSALTQRTEESDKTPQTRNSRNRYTAAVNERRNLAKIQNAIQARHQKDKLIATSRISSPRNTLPGIDESYCDELIDIPLGDDFTIEDTILSPSDHPLDETSSNDTSKLRGGIARELAPAPSQALHSQESKLADTPPKSSAFFTVNSSQAHGGSIGSFESVKRSFRDSELDPHSQVHSLKNYYKDLSILVPEESGASFVNLCIDFWTNQTREDKDASGRVSYISRGDRDSKYFSREEEQEDELDSFKSVDHWLGKRITTMEATTPGSSRLTTSVDESSVDSSVAEPSLSIQQRSHPFSCPTDQFLYQLESSRLDRIMQPFQAQDDSREEVNSSFMDEEIEQDEQFKRSESVGIISLASPRYQYI